MRRIVCHEWGPPENLIVEEAESRSPGPGEVRVQVAAAGVNFVDALFVAGTYQIKVPPPFTPGSEFAGTVVEVGDGVGDGVDGPDIGDLVVSSMGLGAWASEVTLAADRVTRLSDGTDPVVAAGVVQSYCTALFTLSRRSGGSTSETALVLGAAGGVGLASIDVARSLRMRVVAAVSSDEKADAARAAGATEIIRYDREDLKERARELGHGGGVDVVIDPVGGEHTEPALRALRDGGRLAIIGFASGTIPSLPVNQILLRNRSVVGVDWGAWAMANPEGQAELLEDLFQMIDDGDLDPPTPSTRPLDEAGAVLRDLLERRLTGKAVLVP